MKILFVTQFFYPENFRINDLAGRLLSRGHSVSVLTGLPNYPEGEYYEGYSGHRGPWRQSWEGIEIYRVPVIPRKKGSFFLSLNYLSFVIFSCMQAGDLPDDFDIVYAFGTSPITQALAALTYKKKTGARVILNVQDLWPDNVMAITGVKNPVFIGFLDMLVDHIYNSSDLILGTSMSFVRAIKRRRGLKEKRKVAFWPQYSTVKKSDEAREDVLPPGIFHVVFTGNVGEGQGLDILLEAASLLEGRYEGKLVFDIVGDGRARQFLEKKAQRMGLLQKGIIAFHGSFPEEEIPGILAGADAALLILKSDPIFEKTIPAKLQTYLSCARPVVGCVSGESKALIENNKVGFCTENISAPELAKAVEDMYRLDEDQRKAMGARAGALSERLFDPQILVEQLERYMEMLSR